MKEESGIIGDLNEKKWVKRQKRKELNMTLKWISDIRPHLVLECSFEKKRV